MSPAWHHGLKRAFDLLASLAGLVALAPVFTLVAIAIKLDDPGPAIYRQRRVGRDQRHFQILKFRTMRTNTPDLPTDQMLLLPSPITRVGHFLRKTSLDELPQLLNVLKGDMSLVGPRPALYNQAALIAAREAAGVHRMRPGITGWAQVNGRDELATEEKVAYDRYYIEHFHFGLDLAILWRTLAAIRSQRGAY